MSAPVKARKRRVYEVGAPRPVFEVNWKKPTDQEILDFVMTHYDDAKARRLPWEAEAAEQLAMVRGDQWSRWSVRDHDLVQASDDVLGDQGRISVNVLRGRVFAWLGLLFGRPIQWNVVARTHEDDDVNGARIATKLLRYYFTRTDMLNKIMDLAWYMAATGIAWLHVTWDPAGGGDTEIAPQDVLSSVPEDAAERSAAFRRAIAKLRDQDPETLELDEDERFFVLQGDLAVKVVNGFDLSEPYMCRGVNEAAWLIHTEHVSVEETRHRFGAKAAEIDADVQNGPHTDRRRAIYGRSGDENVGGTGAGTRVPDDEVTVHRLWRPKSPVLKDGFYAVVAGGVVLHQGPHPFKHGRMPFVEFRESPDPEHFRPGCTMRDLMALQRAKNQQRSWVQGHLRQTIAPKILKEKGVKIAEDAFDPLQPQIIEVETGTINLLKPWAPEQLPAYAFALAQQLDVDIEEVSRLHRSSLGQRESATQSGKHAEAMQAGDLNSNAIIRQLLQAGLAAAGQQALWLLWENVDSNRITPITGASSEAEVLQWTGKLLSGSHAPFGPWEFNVMVKVVAEDEVGTTIAKVQAMTQMGYLSPENEDDRLRIMTWIEEENPLADEENKQHRANASLEHLRVTHGMPIVINPGDNDLIHVRQHRLWMATSPDFRRAVARERSAKPVPGSTPGYSVTAVRMEQHVKAHLYGMIMKRLEPAAMAEKIKQFYTDFYQLAPAPVPPGTEGGAGPGPGAAPASAAAPAPAMMPMGRGGGGTGAGGGGPGRPAMMPMGRGMGSTGAGTGAGGNGTQAKPVKPPAQPPNARELFRRR